MARRRRFTLTDYQESGLMASSACDLLEMLMIRHPDVGDFGVAHRLAQAAKQGLAVEQGKKAEPEPTEATATP